jgi:putative membrane protein
MSPLIAIWLVRLVALVQTLIAVVEIFLWNHPRVHSRLQFTDGEARKVAPIVANAGLYNAFLAAGLIWGLTATASGRETQMFFLSCVGIAGLFGAITLKPTTLLLQTLPAALALGALWMTK